MPNADCALDESLINGDFLAPPTGVLAELVSMG